MTGQDPFPDFGQVPGAVREVRWDRSEPARFAWVGHPMRWLDDNGELQWAAMDLDWNWGQLVAQLGVDVLAAALAEQAKPAWEQAWASVFRPPVS